MNPAHTESRQNIVSGDAPTRRTVILINEVALKAGAGAYSRAALEERLGQRQLAAEFVMLSEEQPTMEAAEAAARGGAEVVVAVGGDGTVREVALGLWRAGAPAALGILPAGTMNNIAASLAIPEDIDGALELIANAAPRPCDLGLLGELPFVENVGFGAIAGIMSSGESVKRNLFTAPQAIRQTFALLRRTLPQRIRLTLDGRRFSLPAQQVMVCNAPLFGPRIAVAPDARMDDGMLDIVVYQRFGPRELLRHLTHYIGGRKAPVERIRRFRAHAVTLRVHAPWPVQIDGELVPNLAGKSRWRHLDLRVAPGALLVCAGEDAGGDRRAYSEAPLRTAMRALWPGGMPAPQSQPPAAPIPTQANALVETARQRLADAVEPPQQAARRIGRLRWLYFAGAALGVAGAVAVRHTHILPGDLEATRGLQRLKSPAMDRFMTGVAWAGFPKPATTSVSAGVLAFWTAGFRLEALFLGLASGVNGVNWLLKRIIRRKRPVDRLVRVVRLICEPSFPSGHVMHYVSTLGFLMAAAFANLRPSRLRSALVAGCGALIGLVGVARVYLGAHWPSDVVAGYLFGGLYLGGVLEAYAIAKRRQARVATR